MDTKKFKVRLNNPPKQVWVLQGQEVTDCYFLTNKGQLGYYQKQGDRIVDGYWLFKPV